MKTINERIEHVRVTLGYPMAQFARKIGSSPSAVMNVLGEKHDDPSFKMINSIITIFPVSKEWLFMGKGSPFTSKDLSAHEYEQEGGPETDAKLIARVKELRTELNMTQAVFANEVGMSRDALAFMETNRSMLQVPVLKRIVKKFKVNSDWILFGEGEKFRKR